MSPRVGMSYALDDVAQDRSCARPTRATANLLAFGDVADINPVSYGAIAYVWNDSNGDRFVQPNEVDFASGILYSYGVEPREPRLAASPNRIDTDYKSPKLTTSS